MTNTKYHVLDQAQEELQDRGIVVDACGAIMATHLLAAQTDRHTGGGLEHVRLVWQPLKTQLYQTMDASFWPLSLSLFLSWGSRSLKALRSIRALQLLHQAYATFTWTGAREGSLGGMPGVKPVNNSQRG